MAGEAADVVGIQPGTEVRIFSINSQARRRGEPDPGKPGIVVKVGRKLVTIRVDGWDTVFRLDTGRINDDYGNSYFLTPDQVEQRGRRAVAEDVLRSIGLQFTSRGNRDRLTLEQIEALAEVARTFGQEG